MLSCRDGDGGRLPRLRGLHEERVRTFLLVERGPRLPPLPGAPGLLPRGIRGLGSTISRISDATGTGGVGLFQASNQPTNLLQCMLASLLFLLSLLLSLLLLLTPVADPPLPASPWDPKDSHGGGRVAPGRLEQVRPGPAPGRPERRARAPKRARALTASSS